MIVDNQKNVQNQNNNISDVNDVKNNFYANFKKSFTNFCYKIPVKMTFDIIEKDDRIILHKKDVDGKKEYKIFDLSYTEDVKSQIYKIRVWMEENWYPSFTVRKTVDVDLDAEELKELSENAKIKIEKIFSLKKKKEILEHYKVMKVCLPKDIIILDSKDRKNLIFKSNGYPVSILLNKIKKGEDVSYIFTNNFTKINEGYAITDKKEV